MNKIEKEPNMTTPNTTLVDLDAPEPDLRNQFAQLRERAERAFQPQAHELLIDAQNQIVDELERRRDKLNEARARIASIKPRDLPPPLPKVARVAAVAGPGAFTAPSHLST